MHKERQIGVQLLPEFLISGEACVYNSGKLILEDSYIAIHPSFDKLITSLRTATDQDGTLEKESTSYNDIFDAFRLALKFYRFEES